MSFDSFSWLALGVSGKREPVSNKEFYSNPFNVIFTILGVIFFIIALVKHLNEQN